MVTSVHLPADTAADGIPFLTFWNMVLMPDEVSRDFYFLAEQIKFCQEECFLPRISVWGIPASRILVWINKTLLRYLITAGHRAAKTVSVLMYSICNMYKI